MNLTSDPRASSRPVQSGAGSKVGLTVMPIDGVRLDDGPCPGERVPIRQRACADWFVARPSRSELEDLSARTFA
jgi:hypothetical protein